MGSQREKRRFYKFKTLNCSQTHEERTQRLQSHVLQASMVVWFFAQKWMTPGWVGECVDVRVLFWLSVVATRPRHMLLDAPNKFSCIIFPIYTFSVILAFDLVLWVWILQNQPTDHMRMHRRDRERDQHRGIESLWLRTFCLVAS